MLSGTIVTGHVIVKTCAALTGGTPPAQKHQMIMTIIFRLTGQQWAVSVVYGKRA